MIKNNMLFWRGCYMVIICMCQINCSEQLRSEGALEQHPLKPQTILNVYNTTIDRFDTSFGSLYCARSSHEVSDDILDLIVSENQISVEYAQSQFYVAFAHPILTHDEMRVNTPLQAQSLASGDWILYLSEDNEFQSAILEKAPTWFKGPIWRLGRCRPSSVINALNRVTVTVDRRPTQPQILLWKPQRGQLINTHSPHSNQPPKARVLH